ncbi:MAG: hypothetical protein JNJ71_13035 [Rubrivivax sp.]|nr:hypothetical protein [Rubrivivax sp.]
MSIHEGTAAGGHGPQACVPLSRRAWYRQCGGALALGPLPALGDGLDDLALPPCEIRRVAPACVPCAVQQAFKSQDS